MQKNAKLLKRQETMLLWINFQRMQVRCVFTTGARLPVVQRVTCGFLESAVYSFVKWPAKDLSLAFAKLVGRKKVA